MLKFLLVLLFALFSNLTVFAEEIIATYEGGTITSNDAVAQENEQKPLETIVHKVEKEIVPMPTCNDEKLLEETKKFVTAYFKEHDNYNARYRRHKYFVLNNLQGFNEENVGNYKTSETSPISDTIIELKINEKIIEENMRLCKKRLPDNVGTEIYLLLYPVNNGYKVHVLNIEPNGQNRQNNIFTYKN